MSDYDLKSIMEAAQEQNLSLVVEQGHEIGEKYLEGRTTQEAVEHYAKIFGLVHS